jgi:hypothetical protein
MICSMPGQLMTDAKPKELISAQKRRKSSIEDVVTDVVQMVHSRRVLIGNSAAQVLGRGR